jgi:hypothetical protein
MGPYSMTAAPAAIPLGRTLGRIRDGFENGVSQSFQSINYFEKPKELVPQRGAR